MYVNAQLATMLPEYSFYPWLSNALLFRSPWAPLTLHTLSYFLSLLSRPTLLVQNPCLGSSCLRPLEYALSVFHLA